MTERPRTPPKRSKAGQAARAEREARLAEALRDNLRKRKAQSRDRARGRARDRNAAGSGDPGNGEAGGGEA